MCPYSVAESSMASLYPASQTKRIPTFLFENEGMRSKSQESVSLLTSPFEGIACEFGKYLVFTDFRLPLMWIHACPYWADTKQWV